MVGFTMPIGINVISWASINNNFLNPGGEECLKLKVPPYQSGVHVYTLGRVRLGNSKGGRSRVACIFYWALHPYKHCGLAPESTYEP